MLLTFASGPGSFLVMLLPKQIGIFGPFWLARMGARTPARSTAQRGPGGRGEGSFPFNLVLWRPELATIATADERPPFSVIF